jgi:hypothetical protein
VNEFDVTRRGALKYLGILAASAAGREFLASWLPFASAQAKEVNGLVAIQQMHHGSPETEVVSSYTPQFFDPGEFATVDLLAEMIIPADDQPGAHEAHVADYIDFIVFSAAEFAPSLQREWNDGLAILERFSQRKFQKPFRQASSEERLKLLTEMSAPEHDAKLQHEGYVFYRLVKDMTVEGFYTSKIGLIDVLDYQGMNYMADFPGCTHPEHQA